MKKKTQEKIELYGWVICICIAMASFGLVGGFVMLMFFALIQRIKKIENEAKKG